MRVFAITLLVLAAPLTAQAVEQSLLFDLVRGRIDACWKISDGLAALDCQKAADALIWTRAGLDARQLAIVETALEKSRAEVTAAGGVSDEKLYRRLLAIDNQMLTDLGFRVDRLIYPDWKKQPRPRDVSRAYPKAARKANLPGSLLMTCRLDVKGRPFDCWVANETPAGQGFGEGALSVASKFELSPLSVDGRLTEGAVQIPITFAIPTPKPLLPPFKGRKKAVPPAS